MVGSEDNSSAVGRDGGRLLPFVISLVYDLGCFAFTALIRDVLFIGNAKQMR